MEEISGRDFGRLEGKVDSILSSVATLERRGDDTHNDFEARIRGLERWRWGIPGTVLATVVTFLSLNVF